MIDRGIIKWQPFDSCFSSSKILKDINIKKNRERFPILSEDQLELLEEKIKEAYQLNESITINYFYNGKILSISGNINFIDSQDKKIYLNNRIVYFKQIISIQN